MIEFQGYRIQKADEMCNKMVKPVGKGSVPKKLRGLYTNEGEAKRAILNFKSEVITSDKKQSDG